MVYGVFAAAINCIDGRVQIPVAEWLKEKYGVDFVDMITEPGPECLLAECRERATIDSIRKKLEISSIYHKSEVVAIAGHYDCAANPVGQQVQQKQILSAVNTVKSWNLDAEIVGLWVNENWQVTEVKQQ